MFKNTGLIRSNSSGVPNISSLDGLRGIAILMVMMVHFWANAGPNGEGFPVNVRVFETTYNISWFFQAGVLGVRIFFVLSAFLLYLPFAKAIKEGTPFVSYGRFVRRRFLRIIPVFYFVAAVYIILFFLIGRSYFSAPISFANILSNLFFLQPLFHFFTTGITMDIVPGTWTLNPEIYFYLLLPLLAHITKRTPSFVAWMTIMMIFPTIYRHYFIASGDFIWGYNILSQMDIFCFGILLARIFVYLPEKTGLHSYNLYFFLSGCFLFFWCWLPLPALIMDAPFQSGLGCFLAIFGILLNKEQGRLSKVFQNKLLCTVGIVSYSIFLIHDTLTWYGYNLFLDEYSITSPMLRFVFLMTIGVVCSFVIGYLMYKYIELPFLTNNRISTCFMKKIIVVTAFGLLFVVGLFAASAATRNGYSTNFITSNLVTETRIMNNPSYQKVWESSDPNDFTIFCPPGDSPQLTKDKSTFLVTGDSDWVAIIGKLPQPIQEQLKNKQVTIAARVSASRGNLVFAGVNNGSVQHFGNPAVKGNNQWVSVSTLLQDDIESAQLRLNIFPNGSGTFSVKVNHFAIYIKK
ncbi:acyltransferase family protein [Paenibacillus periandrae]|uniref:acyltransferase family protein n=1 Tax=Paenibacillus periandrae TaxID=1761741 RepID=UPI001F09F48E|nr:acyltransferase [Paenibacillus periandrae]